jgi:hypothetical protein
MYKGDYYDHTNLVVLKTSWNESDGAPNLRCRCRTTWHRVRKVDSERGRAAGGLISFKGKRSLPASCSSHLAKRHPIPCFPSLRKCAGRVWWESDAVLRVTGTWLPAVQSVTRSRRHTKPAPMELNRGRASGGTWMGWIRAAAGAEGRGERREGGRVGPIPRRLGA